MTITSYKLGILIALLSLIVLVSDMLSDRRIFKIFSRFISIAIVLISLWNAFLALHEDDINQREKAQQDARVALAERDVQASRADAAEANEKVLKLRLEAEKISKDLKSEHDRIRGLSAQVNLWLSGTWNLSNKPFAEYAWMARLQPISEMPALFLEGPSNSNLPSIRMLFREVPTFVDIPNSSPQLVSTIEFLNAPSDPSFQGVSLKRLSEYRKIRLRIPMLFWAEKNQKPLFLKNLQITLNINDDRSINVYRREIGPFLPDSVPADQSYIDYLFLKIDLPLTAKEMQPKVR